MLLNALYLQQPEEQLQDPILEVVPQFQIKSTLIFLFNYSPKTTTI